MPALRVTVIVALIAFSSGQISLEAKGPPRTILYCYTHSGIIIVSVQETAGGAHGHLNLLAASRANPALQADFNVSRAEFEQMWSTLDAPGVEKYRRTKQHDLSGYYVFQRGGQDYVVKKTSSARAISVLSSRLRAHAEAAMKAGMRSVPFTR